MNHQRRAVTHRHLLVTAIERVNALP